MLLAGSLLGACTARRPSSSLPPTEAVTWPPPPEPPRIRYIGAFSSPADLGITKGLWRRFGEVFSGKTTPRLIRPMAVAVDSKGVIYVADPGAQGVHRFDRGRRRYDLIRGPEGRPLPSPVGLALGRRDGIVVADSLLAALFVISPGAKEAEPLAVDAKLERPTGVAVNGETGEIYVADTGAHHVCLFGPDGKLHSVIGKRGEGPGGLNFPTALWWDPSGRLFVCDSLNFSIQIYDGSGEPAGRIGSLGDATGYLSRPKGVATDGLGHVYVVDALFQAVQIFNDAGELLLHFGRQGHGPGEFWLPAGIFIATRDADAEGGMGEGGTQRTIYVADAHNQRVQMFRYVGERP